EPVIALILPVAARIVVEHGQADYVLGVFEAELGRDTDAQGKAEARRQRLSVEGERHLRLWVQRRRHIDRARIAFRTHKVHVLGIAVGAAALKKGPPRNPAPSAYSTPPL